MSFILLWGVPLHVFKKIILIFRNTSVGHFAKWNQIGCGVSKSWAGKIKAKVSLRLLAGIVYPACWQVGAEIQDPLNHPTVFLLFSEMILEVT